MMLSRYFAALGISLFLFLGPVAGMSQQSALTKVISKSDSALHFTLEVAPPAFYKVKDGRHEFYRMSVPGLQAYGRVGGPELPVFQALLEIPWNAVADIKTLVKEVDTLNFKEEFPGAWLYPRQASACKHPDSVNAFSFNPSLYSISRIHGQLKGEVAELGWMRTFHMGEFTFCPFLYNHQQGRIIYATKVEFVVTFRKVTKDLPFNNFAGVYSPYFQFTESHFLGGVSQKSSKQSSSPVSYVIVSPPAFADSLQEFIEWKQKKGFRIIEAYTDDPQVGSTTTSIKAYLTSLYQNASPANPAPTYLLLVGDIADIPAFSGTTSSHVTDLYYADYTGDNLPDLYYGRFSANDFSQLMPQIRKTLEYEQYLMSDPSFLDEVVMIAGMDSYYASTHANGHINYGTNNYFNSSNGITSNTYLYPASGSSDAQIRSDVSQGVSYVNYTAHGGTGGWVDPTFNNTHVSALANEGKYPLMIGNACLTNSFQINSCFGETLLRADGKGALGYIGASNNTYWDEDFYWGVGIGSISANPTYAGSGPGMFDRLFHTHGEPFSDWYTSQGQMIHAGNLAVQSSSSSRKKYYWEVYHLMGDPSLIVYFGQPAALTLNSPSMILPSATNVDVQTEPYAYVALSRNGILHGAALADSSGLASVSITPFQTPGSVDIVGTRQNRQPYIGTVNVVSPSGGYPVLDNVMVNDWDGNADGYASYGERVHLDVCLNNIGSGDVDSLQLIMYTSDTSVTIESFEANLDSLPASSNDTLLSAFCFKVSNDILDQHVFDFSVEIRYPGDTITFNESMVLTAPKFQLNSTSVSEITGNGNGKPEAGETIALMVDLGNSGHASASQVYAQIHALTPFFIPSDTVIHSAEMLASQNVQWSFPLEIASSCPLGYQLSVRLLIWADSGRYYADTLLITIGDPPIAVIDLDPNSSSAPSLLNAIEANGLTADELNSVPSDLSNYYAVFVCLGIYSANHVLGSSEGQNLATYLNQGGNLYMEGGDTWYYDSPTAVHPYFNINSNNDGSDDLSSLSGQSGSFTNGMLFNYNGENNWIDRLSAQAPAFSVFENSSPTYTAGVAHDAGTYKTIGASFEFGGLVNGSGISTRTSLMNAYLEFFGLIGQPMSPGYASSASWICEDSIVQFNDTSLGSISGWFWECPGGEPAYSDQQNPSVRYEDAGSYDVTLSVSDGINSATVVVPSAITVLSNAEVTLQPTDTSLQLLETAVFASSANGYVSCSWEISLDSGLTWAPLQDDSFFSGSSTPVLAVNVLNDSLDGASFRCVYTGHCGNLAVTGMAFLEIPGAVLFGTTYYLNGDSTVLSGVPVSTQGQAVKSTVSDNKGWYELGLEQAGNYTLHPTPVQAWGGVNATDALAMLRHFVGMDILTGLPLIAGDVDGSGYVNATDALMASQRFVGLMTSFPAGDWAYDLPGFYFDGVQSVNLDIPFLCVGDIDRSYLSSKKTMTTVRYSGTYHENDDGSVNVPLYLETKEGVGALSASFAVPHSWELLNVQSYENQGWLEFSINKGNLKLSWFSLEPFVPADQKKAFITLRIKKDKTSLAESIDLRSLELANEEAEVMKTAVLFLPDGRPAGEIIVGDPFPVPAKDHVIIPHSGKGADNVSVTVISVDGKQVGRFEYLVEKESMEIHVPVDYGAGLFMLRIDTRLENRVITNWKKIVVTD